MGRVREIHRLRRRVRVGAPDPSLTQYSGMAAVTELVDRLAMIRLLDAAIGPIKSRDRGFTAGQVLVGLACAQLVGEGFLVGLDRYRADAAGQVLAAVPGLSSTTAAGLARRLSDGQWRAVETAVGDVHTAMLALLPAQRATALCEQVTIDLDTTDVEVYGRHKRGVAFNHQGQRVGRPHVGTWAETSTVLAADLMAGNEDPRPHAPELLRRALAALPAPARAGRIRLRADAGYFAGELARAALFAEVEFAIGAKRIAPLWRILDGVAETDWTDAIDMTNAQVAVAEYCPDWWPAATRLLIRRVRLDVSAGQVSADPRARRRRTLHPDQRALPLDELAAADAVYGYSFVVTNLDVTTPERAAAVEHWYRHRTSIENMFRDAKHGAALRHLPSGYPEVNRGWMWGALLAASIAGWLHQLTATRSGARLFGHGIRGGQAMIATLRHRLIRVPARLVRHSGELTLRLPPGHDLLNEVLARIRALPATP
ncbi:MAG TPA: IS1380 family transposase [Umezawaea sp.]|nr:IS1380 family transposase [Umezawaea sp.]